jgi:hypothetical protein
VFRAAILCAAIVLSSACSDRQTGIDHARAIASGYLTAVSRDQPDHGWSLLHPIIQAEVFDEHFASYAAAVEAEDRSGFRWEIIEVVPDDPSLHIVTVRVQGGAASIPSILREHNGWSILSELPGSDTAQMSIRLNQPQGVSGVWAFGG